MDVNKVFAMQQSIIELQTKAIDELFLTLMQHMNPDEVDGLEFIEYINKAARLKSEIGDM